MKEPHMAVLAPGITIVPTTSRDNAFLVDGDSGLILVDVGWSEAIRPLFSALDEMGAKASDIKHIVLTHGHPDHVQGAPHLRELTGAAILIHHADADWLPEGRVPPQGRSGVFGRFVDRMPKLHWTPFHADAHLRDGDIIEGSGGLRVIHTPGHSPGHIVLIHEPTRTLLTGDAIFNRGGLTLGAKALAADPAARPSSLARIPADIKAVGFAHGAPLAGSHVETETFRVFLDRTIHTPRT